MPPSTGQQFTRQQVGQPISARQLNQGLSLLEGLSRLGVGPGLGKQAMAGLAPLLRLLGVQAGYARAGPVDIPPCDSSDPDLLKPGKGEVFLLVRTADGLRPRGKAEPCENVWPGVIPANWQPMLVVKIDGVWTVSQLCWTEAP